MTDMRNNCRMFEKVLDLSKAVSKQKQNNLHWFDNSH